ncbi:MAG: thiamine phosphate synthase [Verrucomicrobia bacterium]|nr:thiamine phosphate synthase [Verrucomicrobiota bacterium]
MTGDRSADWKLYAILDLGYVAKPDRVATALKLIAGGADVLQLRAKGHDIGEIRDVAKEIFPICRATGVPFIINDYPELAAELDADGVHIGQDDGPLAAAREVVGSGKIIGRSTHSLAQARAALDEGFDYIGFGPLFPTPTKLGRPSIGLADISAMQSDVGSKIPAFCIGGIKRANLPEVIAAGARRVVIVSDLLTSDDVESATREGRKIIAGG